MGCCLSKKTSPSSSSPSGVSPDPNKSAIDNKPPKAETEAEEAKVEVEESRPKNEAEIQENSNNQRKEVFVIKHRRSHERSKTTTDPEDSTASEEKSTGTNQTPAESPRERRRRTPSREREDSKSYRSGSRERGSGGGSRRVSRSPGRRSETNPNSCAGSGSSRNVASPRSQSPARAASPRAQSPARAAVNASSNAQPSPSKLRRKTEHSPYRRNPLGEIDPNSLAYPQPPHGNTNCNKKMINESANLEGQKVNAKTTIRRSASPSRVTKEQQEAVEECKIVVVSGTEIPKPPLIMSRSRSLRKSRDFDFSPEALLSNNIDNNAPASYAALLLEDIQNFHQKSVNVNAISSSVSKACAVSDLNSTTNKHQRTEVNSFASAAVKKADLMEPSFEKYVTVKRGGSSMEDMEEQESSGSNSVTGSSCVVQRKGGYSASSSWEPNSAESTDRMSGRSSSNKERDRSPFGVQEFDPLKKNGVGAAGGKRVATTTRVATVSV
ncbi:hypothetical protein Rs2_16183 [Raphanus sativus]|nr:hypothetical protein Rs2_16183 [Raphanus sativus]